MSEQQTEQQVAPAPNNLGAGRAVATASIQIIRAGTGKVENYDLTFTEMPAEQNKES